MCSYRELVPARTRRINSDCCCCCWSWAWDARCLCWCCLTCGRMISGLIKVLSVTFYCRNLFFSEMNNNVSFIASLFHSPFSFQNSTAAMCSLPIHWVLRLGMWEIFVVASHFVLGASFVVTRRCWLLRRISSTAKSATNEMKICKFLCLRWRSISCFYNQTCHLFSQMFIQELCSWSEKHREDFSCFWYKPKCIFLWFKGSEPKINPQLRWFM